MLNYVIRRLLLLPLTLFCIILVNFAIINLAPGDPVTLTEISQEGGASRSADRSMAFGSDERYLQFRERYGLTLPILFNFWPWISQEQVNNTLRILVSKKEVSTNIEIPVKQYDSLRRDFGDQARYLMPKLLSVIEDTSIDLAIRSMASRFFARGGTMQATLGTRLTEAQANANRKIAVDNTLLRELVFLPTDSIEKIANKVAQIQAWYAVNSKLYRFEPTASEKISIVFFETRFFRYMARVLTLDFGTMRNDTNKTVISEVTKRFKYSLTLAILPMLITFVLCQVFGTLMAYKQNQGPDYSLSLIFLILYALPIFVVAPFLIEKIALNRDFPFTNTPIPISGFTSPDRIYENLNSYQRLLDIFKHIFLPLIAIMYGSLAAQSRLARTAVLEVLRQDYVRTAWAKGVSPISILLKHVGRNASITIVTSIASSLGIVLGGSLIVETLFEINGFGKFFYDAVINRDYNVIMFSSLAGSLLSLLGFLVADIAYTILDPRLTLE
jgi:peptide/nickel transport system permease protein